MRSTYRGHGRRWTWRAPFHFICLCGLDAYPCHVERMLDRAELGDPLRLYADGQVYADLHQADERRRRRGAR